jgi:hypothetical protein
MREDAPLSLMDLPRFGYCIEGLATDPNPKAKRNRRSSEAAK